MVSAEFHRLWPQLVEDTAIFQQRLPEAWYKKSEELASTLCNHQKAVFGDMAIFFTVLTWLLLPTTDESDTPTYFNPSHFTNAASCCSRGWTLESLLQASPRDTKYSRTCQCTNVTSIQLNALDATLSSCWSVAAFCIGKYGPRCTWESEVSVNQTLISCTKGKYMFIGFLSFSLEGWSGRK